MAETATTDLAPHTGLLTRLARLEGQVDLLTRLIAPHPRTAVPVAEPVTRALSDKVTREIRNASRGNVVLQRHLTKVAYELLDSELDEDAIARKIAEGEKVE